MRWSFPVALLGDFGEEQNFARRLECRQAFGEECRKLLLGRRQSLAQDDRRADVLAEDRMRHRECNGLENRRVVHQSFVNLTRRNLLATAIDDLLQPSGQRQVAVGVDDALIAGAEQPSTNASPFAFGLFSYADCDVLAANDDFAGFSPGSFSSPASSMMAISGPAGTPTEPGLRIPFKGLDAI